MKKIAIIISVIITTALLASTVLAVQLDNPLGSQTPDLNSIAVALISTLLGLVGVLALLAFIYGGFLWLTSLGSPQKIQKGKEVMIWAVLGLAIIFSSYAVITLVLNALGVSKTDSASTAPRTNTDFNPDPYYWTETIE